jgi:hypothetical protein
MGGKFGHDDAYGGYLSKLRCYEIDVNEFAPRG